MLLSQRYIFQDTPNNDKTEKEFPILAYLRTLPDNGRNNKIPIMKHL